MTILIFISTFSNFVIMTLPDHWHTYTPAKWTWRDTPFSSSNKNMGMKACSPISRVHTVRSPTYVTFNVLRSHYVVGLHQACTTYDPREVRPPTMSRPTWPVKLFINWQYHSLQCLPSNYNDWINKLSYLLTSNQVKDSLIKSTVDSWRSNSKAYIASYNISSEHKFDSVRRFKVQLGLLT